MEISHYFDPVELDRLNFIKNPEINRIGDTVEFAQEVDSKSDFKGFDVAIIGINEDRNACNNTGCALAPAEIRKYLYRLFKGDNNLRIVDLGDIRRGNETKDTYFALKTSLAQLIGSGVVPIALGGSQDLTYAMYLAYESLGRIINMVSIDSKFDLATTDDNFDAQSYLSKIILHKPNHLFNFANIGYQTYFVDQSAVKLMNSLYFDVHRLGAIRQHLEDSEPIIRNADMLSFDISAVRYGDAPGNGNASPNGFYGEEVCQLMRYAGLSDKLTSAGFFEMNPKFDRHGQTAHLVAQMIWYLLDGVGSRKGDFPMENADFLKYIVDLTGHKENIVFFKSKSTDRWWMRVPVSEDKQSRYRRHVMVPCSYSDYKTACKDEIPDRWWKACQKLM
jgi:arginase family enzyme